MNPLTIVKESSTIRYCTKNDTKIQVSFPYFYRSSAMYSEFQQLAQTIFKYLCTLSLDKAKHVCIFAKSTILRLSNLIKYRFSILKFSVILKAAAVKNILHLIKIIRDVLRSVPVGADSNQLAPKLPVSL